MFYYYAHFTNDNTKAQRKSILRNIIKNNEILNVGFQFRLPGSKFCK